MGLIDVVQPRPTKTLPIRAASDKALLPVNADDVTDPSILASSAARRINMAASVVSSLRWCPKGSQCWSQLNVGTNRG